MNIEKISEILGIFRIWEFLGVSGIFQEFSRLYRSF
jgi:hypothetical protein